MIRSVFIHTLFLVALALPAPAAEFVVSPTHPGDTVFFRSTATLEFIEGKTTDLAGSISWDPENPTGPVSGILRVDLRTLRTGIETRDEHMRDNHLHTETFPYAWFALDSLSGLPAEIPSGESISGTAHGYFYIHGNKRRLAADISFALDQSGQELSVNVQFAMKLDKYEIERPKALFMKLAETIEVEVVYTARAGGKGSPLELPDWPELK